MARPLKANDFQILDIKIFGDNVEVSIDKRLLTFAGGAFAIELEKLKLQLAESEKTVAVLRQQCTDLQKKFDSVVVDSEKKDAIVASQRDELARFIAQSQTPDCGNGAHSGPSVSTNRNGFHNTDKGSSNASRGQAPTA